MDERLRFVARFLEGEAMTELCREFGISRKTGYKIDRRLLLRRPAPTPLHRRDHLNSVDVPSRRHGHTHGS